MHRNRLKQPVFIIGPRGDCPHHKLIVTIQVTILGDMVTKYDFVTMSPVLTPDVNLSPVS